MNWDVLLFLRTSQAKNDYGCCEHWGVYVEALDYDYEGDFIELTGFIIVYNKRHIATWTFNMKSKEKLSRI